MRQRRSARDLLVFTAIGYEVLAVAILDFPIGVILGAPLTWLPAAVPLAFRRNQRRFRVAAGAAGAWLLFLSASFLIVGGLALLPGAVLLLLAGGVKAGRTWPSRRYWAVAAAPAMLFVILLGVSHVVDRFGPPTQFEVHLVPGTTELQADQLGQALLEDPAVAGVGGEGPFNARTPKILVHPRSSMNSRESRGLEIRLEKHPQIESVRRCRC